MERKFAILVVDDDIDLAANLQDILVGEGYETALAHDGQTALTICREQTFDLAIIDIKLPDIPGVELISQLASLLPGMEYGIITGYASVDSAIQAVKQRSIVTYETKPLNMGHFLALIRQVTERRQAEELYQALASSSPVGVYIAQDRKLVFVNPQFQKYLGFTEDELLGTDPLNLAHAEDREQVRQNAVEMLKGNRLAPYEFRAMTKGGEVVWAMETVNSIHYRGKRATLGNVMDITERRRAEQQLILTNRLASVGEMASGVAHELNNPLTSVIGFSQLLLDKDIPDDVRKDIKVIYSEAQRAAGVVKNLLTFARKHAPVRQLTSINKVVEEVMKLRAYEHRVNNIQVHTRFDPELPEIMVDYFQMQQVFLNIILNAEAAMIEAHNGGALTITIQRTGNIIRASLADDGPGIAREILGRLFDPFFTTKEVGKGTGLGLSICHGVITEHGGRIYAESELGQGATFVVELPFKEID